MTDPDRPSFPVVALLPDLWTVYHRGVAVSQHATMALAIARRDNLSSMVDPANLSIKPPEHSPVVVAQARLAIRKAQQRAYERSDPHGHHVYCEHCQLWHDMDDDCPPLRPRRYINPDEAP